MMCSYTKWCAGIHNDVRVHKMMCGYTKWCAGIQNDVRVYKMMCGYTKWCAGTQNDMRVHKMMCGYTKWCAGIQNDVRLYKMMCWYTKCCAGIQNDSPILLKHAISICRYKLVRIGSYLRLLFSSRAENVKARGMNSYSALYLVHVWMTTILWHGICAFCLVNSPQGSCLFRCYTNCKHTLTICVCGMTITIPSELIY